ncbi:MAG: biotin transporter BioY [Cytophagales bacterium]|nr:biotin transporter BioY [Armatimonadota bacterium]
MGARGTIPGYRRHCEPRLFQEHCLVSVAVNPPLPTFHPLLEVLLPRPNHRAAALARDAALIAAGSLLVAACARIVIPLPFTPVPVTGQTFAVLMVGMLLGARRGALSLLLYLGEGAVGLPVFAGGALGLARLIGPTAGYLWSYPIAACLMGFLAQRGWDRRPLLTAAAMLMGGGVILGMGTLWLAQFVGGWSAAFAKGWLPFLPGDVVKTLLATTLLPATWNRLNAKGPRSGYGFRRR